MSANKKIITLRAENFKRLKAVYINPTGNMVEITGKNAQGKSSILDAIHSCLKVSEFKQEQPVRQGEERGMVSLGIGANGVVELIVTRKFKQDAEGETTTSLTVESKDGATYRTPQTLLDNMLSSLTFDPLEFSKMKPEDQVKAVRSLLPGVDFEAHAAATKVDFDNRTVVNRKIRDLQGELANSAAVPDPMPVRVDKTALQATLTTTTEANGQIETRKANRQAVQDMIDTAKARMSELDTEMADLQAKKEAQQRLVDEKQKKLDDAGPLPAIVDTTLLKQQIAEADAINAPIDEAEKTIAKRTNLATEQANALALTKAIEDRETALQAQIKAAKLPVKDLSFGQDCILLNGLPLNQASDAEQLRTSIAIAMSLNPELKVIRVRDGSLLDEEGLKLLAEMADSNDYQIWIERVDSSGKVGFVIEDGHVKGQEIPETEEKPKAKKAKPAPATAAQAAAPAPAAPAPAPEPAAPVEAQDELL